MVSDQENADSRGRVSANSARSTRQSYMPFAYKGVSSARTNCQNVLAAFCAVMTIMLLTALGYFSFANPDPSTTWYLPGLDAPALNKDDLLSMASSLQIEIEPEYPVNMARIYNIWYVWGFWTVAVPTVLFVMVFSASIMLKERS